MTATARPGGHHTVRLPADLQARLDGLLARASDEAVAKRLGVSPSLVRRLAFGGVASAEGVGHVTEALRRMT